MSTLVRSSVGEFTLASAETPESLGRGAICDLLLPPLCAVSRLPRFCCPPTGRDELARGRPLACTGAVEWAVGRPVAIVDSDENLLALAEYDATRQLLQPRQVFA